MSRRTLHALAARVVRRIRTFSLRWQLVGAVLALLLLSTVIVGAVTTIAFHRFLYGQLDQQLAAASSRYAASLSRSNGTGAVEPGFNTVLGQPVGTLGARIVAGHVESVGVVSDEEHREVASTADRAAIAQLRPTRRPESVVLPDLGNYRIQVVHGPRGALLATGLPEDPVNDTLQQLVVIEVAVLVGAMLLAGLVGAFSVRLSLRPLDRVARTASQVAALPLETGEVSLPAAVPPAAPPTTEVGRVTEAFNRMLGHVDAALTQRQASEARLRRFMADASHELRTPVAVIRSHADYAVRVGGELPEAVAQSLARIGAASAAMGQLVADMLLLARLDAGRPVAHEEVDLSLLVVDAVDDARVAGPDHRWRLDLPDEPINVCGDGRALRQVLSNLLANARLHTAAGTEVTATLAVDADGVDLRVVDTGAGIPPQIRERLFERFVRADTGGAHVDGSTGLGLAIVAAIVRAHGGKISVDSRPGHTEFVVRLPRGQTASDRSATHPEAVAGNGR